MAQIGENAATSGSAPAPRRKRNADRARCGAPRVRGGSCTATGTMPDGRCPHHSTTVSEKTKTGWRQLGQRNSRLSRAPQAFTAANFTDPATTQRLLEEVTDALLRGKIAVSTAKAVSSLAGAAARLTELRAAEELTDLQQQLAERGGVRRRA